MTAVFGAMMPCTQDGVPVTITEVELHSEVDTAATALALRTIPGIQDRAWPKTRRWMPFTAAYGDFTAERFQQRRAGEYELSVAGAVIDRRCRRPPDLSEPIVEWLTLVRAGPEGAKISGERITYEYEGDAYVTELDWTFIICGTLVREDDCPNLDPVPGP